MLSLLLGIHRGLWEDLPFQRVCSCEFYPMLSRSKGTGRAANIWVIFAAQWNKRTYSKICWWRNEEGNRSFPRGWNKSVWLIKTVPIGIGKRDAILDSRGLKRKLGRLHVMWHWRIPLLCAWIWAITDFMSCRPERTILPWQVKLSSNK